MSVPARGRLVFDRCLVMGIVNRTPDSFYRPGPMDLDASVATARALVADGADLLDVGGVKAGPGSEVTEREEMNRVVPVVEALASEVTVPLSVDTSRPAVARRALAAGAIIVNDVSGLEDPELAAVCAEHDAWLVLIHHGGQIRSRPRHPRYDDVVKSVIETWAGLEHSAIARGMPRSRLIADPGLDFGKTTFHSLELLRRLGELKAPRLPLLVAPSRKDVVGETLELPPSERLEGTLALVAVCAQAGIDIIRVHDVRSARRTVTMIEAVEGRRLPQAPVRGLWD